MNSAPLQSIECRVVGGDKLPAEAGGSGQLCAAIERAAAQSPALRFSVEVHVLGESSLAATLITANGTVLPVQKFAVSDRALNPDSIERFASSLVSTVARAQNR